jgi:quercetin dioxygenase-like cupin family protein
MKAVRFFAFSFLFTMLISIFSINTASAQDAAEVDPEHYKVEFENEKVRVLRITYGPGDKSVMHEHPEGVVIFLSDGVTKMTFADGTSQEMKSKAGQVVWTPVAKHQPENLGDEGFEVIQIELKKVEDD